MSRVRIVPEGEWQDWVGQLERKSATENSARFIRRSFSRRRARAALATARGGGKGNICCVT